jgi:hypothetical protein
MGKVFETSNTSPTANSKDMQNYLVYQDLNFSNLLDPLGIFSFTHR